MNISSRWLSWRQCVVRVRVAGLDVSLRILRITSLLLAITALLVSNLIVHQFHAREQWRKQERI
jgi:hypothetical protein